MRELSLTPIGAEGRTVDAEATFIGGEQTNLRTSGNIGGTGKEPVFSLVERGCRVRTRHVVSVSAQNLKPILVKHLDRASSLMTEGEGRYRFLGPIFAQP
jgi:hypothetical protein